MPHHRKSVRVLISAALAATTTLTGPTFAFAEQNRVLRFAQAADDQVAPSADPAEASPPPAPEPAPAPEPEPPAEPVAPARQAEPEPAPAEAPVAAEPRQAEPAADEQPPRRTNEGDASPGEAPARQPDPAPAARQPSNETQGEASGGETRQAPAAVPAETAPPAEPAAPQPPVSPDAAAPGQAPAGETTPATPDASAPAAVPAPVPGGEVPTAPPATGGEAAPVAPTPSTPPGAPDATTAAPRNDPAPAPAPAPAPDGTLAPPAPVAPAAPDGTTAGGAAPAPVPAQPPAGQPPVAPPAAEAPPATVAPPLPAANLNPQPVPADVQNAPVEPGRIDQSDARVQILQQPVQIQPITQERGERLREAPSYELPPDAQVVGREGNRQILSLGAAAVAGAVAGAAAVYFIRSNDDQRLGVDATENYTERLPRGRTRETIVRPNGVQVVTITNRYGDVVQRSRVMPDGREVVLFYDPYSEDAQRPDYYDDPGRDLPPIRVDIPEDEYVVDINEPDEGIYYDTLVAPPVETVERIYSVNEVRRSPRIREKVRRIDLATVNFDFGSASIAQNQVPKLQALAEAVQRIVKDNPGESFLIEGHTDAVGSNEANLVLSDQRAEAVASALTRYFEVPAENLVTQGYGEQELKVKTQGENRENRRVTVRRITALVKPIQTSNR